MFTTRDCVVHLLNVKSQSDGGTEGDVNEPFLVGRSYRCRIVRRNFPNF